jgi:hypothetical protein
MCRLSWNVGHLTFWNRQDLARPYIGIALTYLTLPWCVHTVIYVARWAMCRIDIRWVCHGCASGFCDCKIAGVTWIVQVCRGWAVLFSVWLWLSWYCVGFWYCGLCWVTRLLIHDVSKALTASVFKGQAVLIDSVCRKNSRSVCKLFCASYRRTAGYLKLYQLFCYRFCFFLNYRIR